MKRLRCYLGSHVWSCEGRSGYWICSGDHHCIHCGFTPRGGAS